MSSSALTDHTFSHQHQGYSICRHFNLASVVIRDYQDTGGKDQLVDFILKVTQTAEHALILTI